MEHMGHDIAIFASYKLQPASSWSLNIIYGNAAMPCTVRKPATTHHSPSHPMMASEVIMSLPTWKSLTVATHTTARTRAPTPGGRTRAPTRAPIQAHTQEVPIWVSNMGNYGQTNCRMFWSATNHGFIQLFLNGTSGTGFKIIKWL